ncbi:MAG: ABC transporter permease [Spirochaetales bacterium]|nr:ABC transporter permease [Spirochaetales bacterium]
MPDVLKAFSIIYFGSTGWTVLFSVLYIIGLSSIFRKTGTAFWWALIPFARDYRLGLCANRRKSGLVVMFARIILAAIGLFIEWGNEQLVIARFSIPMAAVSLVIILFLVVYQIKIYRGLTEVFSVGRAWTLAWLFFNGPTALYWGFSKKMMPVYGDESPTGADTVGRSWFGNLLYCLKRSSDRFFFDGKWRCLPIAVAITALVASIARNDFFQTMEGTIKGSLALTCIAIWNGCFNSILSVCEDRSIIASLRSDGLHISAYIISTLLTQVVLCLLETILVMYTCTLLKIDFPQKGLLFPSLISEIGMTMFLITLAADLMSLCVSAIVRKPVNAMTIMPFLLVVQLVFSGTVINVAGWSNSISRFTISNYGVKCIASQSDYNNRPMVLGWNLLESISDNEVGTTITVGQILDALGPDTPYPAVADIRSSTIGDVFTIGDVRDLVGRSDSINHVLDEDMGIDMSIAELVETLMEKNIIPDFEELKEREVGRIFTVQEIYSILERAEGIQGIKEKKILFDAITVGSILDLVVELFNDTEVNVSFNLGEVLESAFANEEVRAILDLRPLEGMSARDVLEKVGLVGLLDRYDDY